MKNSHSTGRLVVKDPKEIPTLVDLIRTCAEKKDIHEGERLLAQIREKGFLEKSTHLFTSLIDMYAKLGILGKALEVHDELPIRDLDTWNALIRGYSRQGQGYEAWNCFLGMQIEGLSPDVVTFICLFKACGSIGNVDKGKLIHEEILRRGLLEKHITLGNALVDMYAKCGMLEKALHVVNELPSRTIASWNTLISAYTQHGHAYEALNCFKRMEKDGLSPNAITFVCTLKACGSVGAIGKGKEIHGEIIRRRLLENNIVLGNALVDMYAKCGVLAKAQEVLDGLLIRNTVSWSSLIAGYSQQGQDDEALNCYEQMQSEGHYGDEVTFVSILKVCASSRYIEKGKQIHDEIVARGLPTKNIMLGNALVDMYAKCGMMTKAQELHGKLYVKNVVSWNSLIAGYAEQGQGHEAIKCFEQMQRDGFSPDVITFVCILKACGRVGDIGKGKQVHEEIVKRKLLENNIVLGSALVDMYVKCGVLAKAQHVLERLSARNEVCWSAVIAGYIQQGLCHEAITCFEWMLKEGFSPNAVTLICILKACGNLGAIVKGKLIHNVIISSGLLEKDIAIGTALVDMYARCGMLAQAREVLEEIPVRNIVSWSALIAGYAQHGQVYEAMDCFEWMQCEGFLPNDVTFLCLLNACSQSGRLKEAQIYFDNMRKIYGITPNLEHHTCMVVLLGYTGHFNEAVALIETMPSFDHVVVWVALLGACRKWGNQKLSRLAFDQIIQLDSKCGAAYALMSNVYADAGMKEDAEKVEAMSMTNVDWRNQGDSNIYVDKLLLWDC